MNPKTARRAFRYRHRITGHDIFYASDSDSDSDLITSCGERHENADNSFICSLKNPLLRSVRYSVREPLNQVPAPRNCLPTVA